MKETESREEDREVLRESFSIWIKCLSDYKRGNEPLYIHSAELTE